MSRSGRSRRFVSLVVLAGLMSLPFAGLAVVVTAQAAGAGTCPSGTLDSQLFSLGNLSGIAVSGGHVFVADFNAGTVGEYTTAGATVNASFITGLSQPQDVAVSGNDLFVTNFVGGTVGEYDATTGALINGSFITGLGNPNGLAVSGGHLFVADDGDYTVGEYDAITGAAVNVPFITGLNGPQHLAVSGSHLFVANLYGNSVGEYDATTGATVNASFITGLSDPVGVAVFGGNLFVANSIIGTAGEYDATTGATINASFITGLSNPQGVVVSGGDLFVANFNTGTVGEWDAATGADVTVTCTNSVLSGGGQSGASVSVSASTYVSDAATLTGDNAPTATGTVTYTVYSDAACTVAVSTGDSEPITTPGTLPASAPVALSTPGTYYWQATYSGGDGVNGTSASTCGSGGVVETVGPSTCPSGNLDSLVSDPAPLDIAISGSDLFLVNSSGTVGEYSTSGATINASLITGLSGAIGIAVSGSDLFVTNQTSGTVGEYTTSGATVNASLITGLNTPIGIAVSGSDLFVVANGSGTVGEYTTSGATVNASLITGLSTPFGLAVSGSNLFLTTFGSNTVGEYTTSGATVNASLITGLQYPFGIAVSGSNLYVTNLFETYPALIAVGEYTTSGAVVNASLVTGLSYAEGIAVSGSDLFVVVNGSNTVGEYDAGTGAAVTVTCTNTALSGGGQSGNNISVPASTNVTESATPVGDNASTATGSVTYTVYSDAACTIPVSTGSPETITSPGVLPASAPVALPSAGTYYWRATYSGGDGVNGTSASTCGTGGDVETVLPAPAVSLYVTTTGSGATCSHASPCGSIQAAIDAAEGGSYNGDDVTVNVAAGTYTENDNVSASSLNSLTIAGAGASSTTVNGGGSGTVFNNTSETLTISGLTITNGETGIHNSGTMTVTDCTVSGNIGGSGIFLQGYETLTLTNSTVSGNTSDSYGGGIGVDDANVIVTDSTIADNSASAGGGGIFAYEGSTTVTDSTVSGNTSSGPWQYPSFASQLVNDYAVTVSVGATILADSTSGNCDGVTDMGYNIADDSSCGFTATGSVNSSATLDASLGALANYGGPTPTILPTLTSPAVGVIPTGTTLNSVSVCPRTDQRGVASVGNCTIGAVEVPPPGGLTVPGAPTGVSGTPGDGQVALGWSAPASDGGSPITDYAVSVFNSSGGPATGVSGATTRFVGSATTNFAFTGLTPETAYTFRVAAVSSVGSGTLSVLSSPVTPFAVPGAPTSVVGVSGNGQVSLSWVAPADNGGSAVTDYQVSVFDSVGGAATGVTGSSTRSVGSPVTHFTFTGLTNATGYRFAVAAVNVAGLGAPSVLSGSVVASSFTVPAKVPNPGTAGFDSGYVVNNSVTISASGSWCPDGTPADCVGADGGVNAAGPGSLLVGSSGQFGLVGRIGSSGVWRLIGSGPVTLNGTGELYLAMNDVAGQFADNSGSLQVSLAPLDGVTGVTPPVSATLTSGYDAAWSVPVINDSGVALTGVSATVDANANGPVPLSFDTALMPVGCVAGAGSSLVCPVPNVPAHSTYLFNVYVPTSVSTNDLGTGRSITGDVAVSANGGLNASGTLGSVSITSCGSSCVVVVAPPGHSVSSTTPPTTPAAPPQQTVTLPAAQAGATPEPVAVTLSTITPAAGESVSDQKLCPTAANQTHCSGKISSVVGDFSKFNDAANPIRVKVVTDWGAAVPAGRVLMEKSAGGDPLFLLGCVRNPTTHRYNTPCLLSETTAGSTNKITTDTILFTGLDVHFARRTATGLTKISPPAAPTGLSATVGSTTAVLKWKAPTATNGAGVTSYVVTVLAAGKPVKTVSYPSPLLTQTVTGLTNGKAYSFKVAAGNVAGTGAASAVTVATVVGAPGAPSVVKAVKVASGQLKVTFTAPTATNGAAITLYTVSCTSSNGGAAKTKTGHASPITDTGLGAGKQYTCTVKATNSRGVGPASTPSAAVTA